jgi:hypothetical protein
VCPRSTRIHHPCTVLSRSTRLITALALTCVFASLACAQQKPATCADWFAVQRWSGTLSFSGSGTQTYTDGGSYTTSHSGTVTFTTDKGTTTCDINTVSPANPGGWGWSAQSANVTLDVSIHDVSISFGTDDNNQRCEITTHYDIDHGTTSNRGAQINMTFNSATGGTYFLSAISFIDGVRGSSTGCGHSGVSTTSLTWGPATNFTPVSVPSNIGMLSGSQQLTDVSDFGDINWTANWSATPYFSWDVLIKSNPDYAQWRPMAGRTENDLSAGLLGMVAYVVDKDTGEHVAGVSVDGWIFQLKDVSHEPGVALNYPPKGKLVSPSPPDLDFKFVNDGIFPNVKVSADGLTLEATPDPSTDSDIAVFMNSRDWGAWGTLNVQTTIAGQVVKAHFENEEATDILLPKRQQGSFIADNWKIAQQIPLDTLDLDDSENEPVGDGNTGDGFSLYEEYRGFYMGCARSNGFPVQESTDPGAVCKHVEGDPHRKDLFVASELSAEESLGIKKFKEETTLNVHYKGLSEDEIAADNLINFNHAQGPHLENGFTAGQHALFIRWDPERGTSTAAGGPGVPRKISTILLAGAADGLLKTTTPGNEDGDNYFTATVAHELSHGVDVYHHGENGEHRVYWYVDGAGQIWETGSTDTSGNPVHGTGVPIQVLDESQDPLTAGTNGPWQSGLLSPCNAMDNTCPPAAGRGVLLGNRLCSTSVQFHGQYSGDQDCYMRYDAAEAYIPQGFPNVRYLVEETTGQHLTDVSDGTGVNDPDHETGAGPLSRYGSADTGHQRGKCLSLINVNDLTDPPAHDAPPSCTAN